jgi:hypothetical protein
MVSAEAHNAASVRAAYFIDPAGIVRAMNWYPLAVGRSVDEILRIVTALQRTEDGQCLAPEGLAARGPHCWLSRASASRRPWQPARRRNGSIVRSRMSRVKNKSGKDKKA